MPRQFAPWQNTGAIKPPVQSASAILMIRPKHFGYNAECAVTNHFVSSSDTRSAETSSRARHEFDTLAEKIASKGCQVVIVDDTSDPAKPDAIFSNNWLSLHDDGTAIGYPLAASSRRPERRQDRISTALKRVGFNLERWHDLTYLEDQGQFLEGTGSLVLDRLNRTAYACISDRTHPEALQRFSDLTSWSTFSFCAADDDGRPVYHTNVILCLGTRFALLCKKMIAPADRAPFVASIEATGREVINLAPHQIAAFAANAIELRDGSGRLFVAMSTSGYRSLIPAQRDRLEALAGELVHVEIPTIERNGGGSVRCCITEIHLPRIGDANTAGPVRFDQTCRYDRAQ